MKTVLIAIVAALALFFLWPKLRKGYAKVRGHHLKATGHKRKLVLKHHAQKGDDSGGVLTQAGNC